MSDVRREYFWAMFENLKMSKEKKIKRIVFWYCNVGNIQACDTLANLELLEKEEKDS